MENIKEYVQAKSVDGKVPLSEVYHFLKVSHRMPTRTVQWYIKEQLIPKPSYDWKNGYYDDTGAIEVLERAYLISKLKEYMNIKFSTIRNILRLYSENIEELLEGLLPIVKEYSALKSGDDPYEPVLDEGNAEIVRRVCDLIERGVPIKEISAPDIQDEM